MKFTRRTFLKEYSLTILIAVGIAFFLRTFVIESYQISNFSMKPTLLRGDTIFVAKWPSWLKTTGFPQRGDVIVYSDPRSDQKSGPDHLKRLIGLPGDKIQIEKGILYLNHQRLNEATQGGCFPESLGQKTYEICREAIPMGDMGPLEIPEHSFFVIDDLRIQTLKGKNHKTWAIIPTHVVKGRALWIWLSIDPQGKTGTQSTWLPSFRSERMLKGIH